MPVVDASIVVDWVAPDVAADSPARELARRLADTAAPVLAPRLLREEVANALLSGWRRGRWDGVAADAAFWRMTRLPLHLVDEPDDVIRAWELSRRYDGHPVYDMVYVAVAQRLEERLVTADEVLRRRLVGADWVVAAEDW